MRLGGVRCGERAATRVGAGRELGRQEGLGPGLLEEAAFPLLSTAAWACLVPISSAELF